MFIGYGFTATIKDLSACIPPNRNPALAALNLNKTLVPVKGTRTVRKADMIHNGYMPKIDVDPETYIVRADGILLACEPASILPMAQRYFLF